MTLLLTHALAVALIQTSSSPSVVQGDGAPPSQAPARFVPHRLTGPKGESLATHLTYPTPALLDLDGDGARELVVGDLRGAVRFAERPSPSEAVEWSALEEFTTGDRALKFHNW